MVTLIFIYLRIAELESLQLPKLSFVRSSSPIHDAKLPPDPAQCRDFVFSVPLAASCSPIFGGKSTSALVTSTSAPCDEPGPVDAQPKKMVDNAFIASLQPITSNIYDEILLKPTNKIL